jgi:hypothetical protein
MRDFIDSQIAAKRSILEELDRKRLTVEAELRTYEEMRAHLAQPSLLPDKKPNGAHPPKPANSAIPSEMTEGWRKILCKLDALGRSFGAADIVSAGDELGAPTKMLNARSQIYQWERKHIIARVRKGKYRLAQKGLETVKKTELSEREMETSASPVP